jgi:hypothetical protein
MRGYEFPKLNCFGFTGNKGSTVIGIPSETVKAIEGKFGREKSGRLLKDYDIAGKLEALAEREGRHIHPLIPET